MPGVRRMPMTVVDVIHMIPVRHRHMPAVRPVLMIVAVMRDVPGGLALIEMIVMRPVQMPVVRVVDVIAMRNGNMAATRPVDVIVSTMSSVNL